MLPAGSLELTWGEPRRCRLHTHPPPIPPGKALDRGGSERLGGRAVTLVRVTGSPDGAGGASMYHLTCLIVALKGECREEVLLSSCTDTVAECQCCRRCAINSYNLKLLSLCFFFFFLPSPLWSSGSLNFVTGNFILEKGTNKHPLVEMGEDPGET